MSSSPFGKGNKDIEGNGGGNNGPFLDSSSPNKNNGGNDMKDSSSSAGSGTGGITGGHPPPHLNPFLQTQTTNNNPFLAFNSSARKIPKVNIVGQHYQNRNNNSTATAATTGSDLNVRNRDKWLNIDQATRLSNLQRSQMTQQSSQNQMGLFKAKYGHSSHVYNYNLKLLNEKRYGPMSGAGAQVPYKNIMNNRASYPVWQPNQNSSYVQRGMLKSLADYQRDPHPYLREIPLQQTATATATAPKETDPVKICYVNIDDDEAAGGGDQIGKAASAKRTLELDDVEVTILDDDDVDEDDSSKEESKKKEHSSLVSPSGYSWSSASKTSTPTFDGNKEKKQDKYHVPGALGWFVHVPDSKFNNHYIPCLPRFDERKSDKQ